MIDTKREPNHGYKAHIYVNEYQKEIILDNMTLTKYAYNYARGYNLHEVQTINEAKEKYRQKLKEEGKSEDEILSLIKVYEKENSVFKIASTNEIRKALLEEIPNKEHYLEILKKEGREKSVLSNVLYFNYKAALDRFKDKENFQKHKQRVKEKVAENIKKRKKYPSTKEFIPHFPEDYGFPQKKFKANSYKKQIDIKNVDFEKNRIYLSSKIGWVRVSKHQPLLPEYFGTNLKYITVSTDGHNFFISIPYYKDFKKFNTPQTEILGVDLGLSEVAILSNGTHVPNISKTEKYQKIQQKIKGLNKKKCWLVEHSPKSWNIKDPKEKWKKVRSRQFNRIENRIRKLQLKLNHMKHNYYHEWCEKIVQNNPKGIIFENLNIKGMQRNRKLSSSVQNTSMALFKTLLTWHATKHLIPVKEADKFFPSSQLCSVCGGRNKKMKGFENLNKRVFKCPHCGAEIQRDENAALNLRNIYDSIPEVINQDIMDGTNSKKHKIVH